MLAFCSLIVEKPHNPMINAGSILTCALLNTLVHPEMSLAEKFDFTQNYFSVSSFRVTACNTNCKFLSFTTFSAWLVGLISALITPCFYQNEKLLIVIMLSASICANTNVFQKMQTCESVWTSIFR